MYYQETIDFLKKQGLITAESVAVVCKDYNPSAQIWGGLIGAAIAAANANQYILAADENVIRIFDIDKTNGIYQNTFSEIKRADVKGAGASGFGGKTVAIKSHLGTFRFVVNNKFKGFRQKEAVRAVAAIIKANYSRKALKAK